MKKLVLFFISSFFLVACDKTYVCNCGLEGGGLPYKKIYIQAKTENSAERQCSKKEEAGETCVLQ